MNFVDKVNDSYRRGVKPFFKAIRNIESIAKENEQDSKKVVKQEAK